MTSQQGLQGHNC